MKPHPDASSRSLRPRTLRRNVVAWLVAGAFGSSGQATLVWAAADAGETRTDSSSRQAHEFELGLNYAAPPECPTGPEFLDRLSNHLQSSDLAPFPSTVEIEHDGDSYRLHLYVRLGGLAWQKTEAFSSCSDAAEVAAFDIAMARTQRRRLQDAMRDEVLSKDRAGALATNPYTKRNDDKAPDDEYAVHDDEARNDAEAQRELYAAPPVGSASSPSDRDRPTHGPDVAGSAHQLSLRYQSRTGLLPKLAHGLSLEHRLPLGSFSLLSELSAWQPQVHAYGETQFPRLSFRSASVTAGPCSSTALGVARLSAWGCAIVSGHVLAVQAQGPNGSSGARVWASWGVDLGTQARLTPALALGLGIRVQSALSTPSVRIAPWDTLAYRASAAQLGAHLGLTVALGDPSRQEAQ